MNLTISQNIFNTNYRNTVKKENQKKSNQTNAISKNQSFQVFSKQASQALKNNISFGAPQRPSLDAESTIDLLYKTVALQRIIPATARTQEIYKQELLNNLETFKNSDYDDMSIADNVLNNTKFLDSNNFAKVEQPERNAFQIFAYPKDDNFVQSVKIGKNGQRLGNVGFVCFDFVGCNGENMLNSYSIKSQGGSYLSGLKVKLKEAPAPAPERGYKVYRATDLKFINFLNEINTTTINAAVAVETATETAEAAAKAAKVAKVVKTAEAAETAKVAAKIARIAAKMAANATAAADVVAFDILMATNKNVFNGDSGTVGINGANVDFLAIDNDLNAS